MNLFSHLKFKNLQFFTLTIFTGIIAIESSAYSCLHGKKCRNFPKCLTQSSSTSLPQSNQNLSTQSDAESKTSSKAESNDHPNEDYLDRDESDARIETQADPELEQVIDLTDSPRPAYTPIGSTKAKHRAKGGLGIKSRANKRPRTTPPVIEMEADADADAESDADSQSDVSETPQPVTGIGRGKGKHRFTGGFGLKAPAYKKNKTQPSESGSESEEDHSESKSPLNSGMSMPGIRPSRGGLGLKSPHNGKKASTPSGSESESESSDPESESDADSSSVASGNEKGKRPEVGLKVPRKELITAFPTRSLQAHAIALEYSESLEVSHATQQNQLHLSELLETIQQGHPEKLQEMINSMIIFANFTDFEELSEILRNFEFKVSKNMYQFQPIFDRGLFSNRILNLVEFELKQLKLLTEQHQSILKHLSNLYPTLSLVEMSASFNDWITSTLTHVSDLLELNYRLFAEVSHKYSIKPETASSPGYFSSITPTDQIYPIFTSYLEHVHKSLNLIINRIHSSNPIPLAELGSQIKFELNATTSTALHQTRQYIERSRSDQKFGTNLSGSSSTFDRMRNDLLISIVKSLDLQWKTFSETEQNEIELLATLLNQSIQSLPIEHFRLDAIYSRLNQDLQKISKRHAALETQLFKYQKLVLLSLKERSYYHSFDDVASSFANESKGNESSITITDLDDDIIINRALNIHAASDDEDAKTRVIPIPNSFKDTEHQRVPGVKKHRRLRANVHLGTEIPFTGVTTSSSSSSSALTKTQVNGDTIGGLYTSLQKEMPYFAENITFILAGRGSGAQVPANPSKGRSILILSPDQAAASDSLVSAGVDTIVVNKLKFNGRFLTAEEIGYFTARRLAAFEIAGFLGIHSTIAVVDDNIEKIQVSNHLMKSGAKWDHLFDFATDLIRKKSASMVGLLEFNPKAPKEEAQAEWTLHEQNFNTLKKGFSSKIFFFDFEKIAQVSNWNFSILFPPLINLPQEDLYLQLFLEKAASPVYQFDRNTVEFSRVFSPSLAKEFIRNSAVKSSTWHTLLPLPGPSIQNEVLAKIQELVKADEVDSQKQRQHQISKDLSSSLAQGSTDSSPPTIDLTIDDEIDADLEDTKVGPQKKAKVKPGLIEELDSIENFRYGELDSDATWEYFTNSILSENPVTHETKLSAASSSSSNQPAIEPASQALWKHQVEALEALKASLKKALSKKKKFLPGYFDLATGTGKTRLIEEVLYSASKTLNGNLILISPQLQLKKQIQEAISKKVPKGISVSSSFGDVSAKLASLNVPIGNGRNVLIFCEKSFLLYLKEKKGDLKDASLIIYDESHLVKGGKYLKALSKEGGLLLGFSATPSKKEVFKDLIYQFPTEEGVQAKILAPWVTRSIKIQDISKFENIVSVLPTILDTELHPMGGKLKDHRGVIFLQGGTAQQTDQLAQALNQAQISAAAFHYKVKDPESVIAGFADGRIRNLIAIRSLREGFNEPQVDYVFIIGKTKPTNNRDLIQIRGRALRIPKNQPPSVPKVALFLTSFSIREKSRLKLNFEKVGINKAELGVQPLFWEQPDATYIAPLPPAQDAAEEQPAREAAAPELAPPDDLPYDQQSLAPIQAQPVVPQSAVPANVQPLGQLPLPQVHVPNIGLLPPAAPVHLQNVNQQPLPPGDALHVGQGMDFELPQQSDSLHNWVDDFQEFAPQPFQQDQGMSGAPVNLGGLGFQNLNADPDAQELPKW